MTGLSERGSRTSGVLSSEEDLLPSLRHCWLLKIVVLLAVVYNHCYYGNPVHFEHSCV